MADVFTPLAVAGTGPGTQQPMTHKWRDLGDSLAPSVAAVLSPPSLSIAASSGNVANAVATATLAAVAGRLTYVSGFEITGGGATAGSLVFWLLR